MVCSVRVLKMSDNKKKQFKSVYVFSICLGIVWLLMLICVFVVPEVKREYMYPDIRVELSAPLIGVHVIDSKQLSWEIIREEYVVKREDKMVFFEQRCQAYVSFDQTEIQDTFKNDHHVLSDTELCTLLSDYCAGVVPAENLRICIEDIPIEVFSVAGDSESSAFLPKEFSVAVEGRYEGSIAFKSYLPPLPSSKTNIDEEWRVIDHFPVKTILYITFIAILFTVTCISILSHSLRRKLGMICLALISLVLLLALFLFLG